MAEREDRCVVEKCTNIGAHKFFGHSICRKHKKRIPGPLEVYAASWIKAEGDIAKTAVHVEMGATRERN